MVLTETLQVFSGETGDFHWLAALGLTVIDSDRLLWHSLILHTLNVTVLVTKTD